MDSSLTTDPRIPFRVSSRLFLYLSSLERDPETHSTAFLHSPPFVPSYSLSPSSPPATPPSSPPHCPPPITHHHSHSQPTPPKTELGLFLHAVESEMLCSNLLPTKVPYFNAPIYLENKTQIGKIDEILGPINEVYFTVKMNEGMVAGSFKKDDKIYIAADKLLPIERFLPKPKAVGGKGEWLFYGLV